jgi:hypothetical protein
MIRKRADPVLSLIAPIVGDPDGRCEADALRIGGTYTPGIMTISKGGLPFDWDKRKGYGYSGAYLVYTGQDLVEFDTTFTIWRQDQYDDWIDWAKTNLVKEPGQPQVNGAYLPNVPRPKALGVYNPILADLAVTAIVPKHIGFWVGGTGAARGKWSKTISWYQFRGPQPFLGKPKEPIPDVKPKAPTADDAFQLELRAKRQTIQAKLSALSKGHS